MNFRLLMIFVLACPISGCASPGNYSGPRYGVRCEDVVAEGMGSTETKARRLAEDGVRQQLADARGNLLASGLHRIRPAGRQTRCAPHSLGMGFVKCRASMRLCGR